MVRTLWILDRPGRPKTLFLYFYLMFLYFWNSFLYFYLMFLYFFIHFCQKNMKKTLSKSIERYKKSIETLSKSIKTGFWACQDGPKSVIWSPGPAGSSFLSRNCNPELEMMIWSSSVCMIKSETQDHHF